MSTQSHLPGTQNVTNVAGGRTETDALAERVQRAYEPRVIDIARGDADKAALLLTPAGMEVRALKSYLDAYLPKPARRAGTTTLHDLASFVAAVKRAKGEGTVVYLDANRVIATAVFDHDLEGADGEATARWGGHRAVLTIGKSVAWSEWGRVHGTSMSQADFAAFIDDRLADILDPGAFTMQDPENPLHTLMETLAVKPASAADVVEASRGLKLRAEVNVTERVSTISGEVELVYGETHAGADGYTLRVPSAFLIAVPVFDGAPRDVMLVRLRYRRVQGQPRVNWTATVYQREEILSTALRDLAAHIEDATGCPTLLGEPPPDRTAK